MSTKLENPALWRNAIIVVIRQNIFQKYAKLTDGKVLVLRNRLIMFVISKNIFFDGCGQEVKPFSNASWRSVIEVP